MKLLKEQKMHNFQSIKLFCSKHSYKLYISNLLIFSMSLPNIHWNHLNSFWSLNLKICRLINQSIYIFRHPTLLNFKKFQFYPKPSHILFSYPVLSMTLKISSPFQNFNTFNCCPRWHISFLMTTVLKRLNFSIIISSIQRLDRKRRIVSCLRNLCGPPWIIYFLIITLLERINYSIISSIKILERKRRLVLLNTILKSRKMTTNNWILKRRHKALRYHYKINWFQNYNSFIF